MVKRRRKFQKPASTLAVEIKKEPQEEEGELGISLNTSKDSAIAIVKQSSSGAKSKTTKLRILADLASVKTEIVDEDIQEKGKFT
jgi:hypothetical protein